ncbi:unnamed protein product [Owenia fusiformis]|uniref:Uncharacterized protein n=1 Tax=Owenia fusiformis TaxID=6347 RepID=A0A8J1UAM5_OWEFU|nr:unnamed protein product [Owenia fusiformis]
MSGRYTRQPVPLEVRGISREGTENHPLPEKPDDYDDDEDNLPQHFLSCIQEAITTNSNGSQLDSEDGETITETQSWLGLSNDWTGGNVTERSSTYSSYSFGEDEFDKKASQTVRHLFQNIDANLFEGKQGPKHLASECQDWVNRFTHLRLLGQNVAPPKEEGYEVIPNGDTPVMSGSSGSMLMDVTEHDMSAVSHDPSSLRLMGHQVSAKRVPSTAREGDFPHLEEEIFEEEGIYEDIMAVDYSEDRSDKKAKSHRQKSHAYPPITPNACVKDNVMCEAIDYTWEELIGWMRNLLKVYGSILVQDPERHVIDGGIPDSLVHDLIGQISDMRLDHIPPHRDSSYIRSPDDKLQRIQTANSTVKEHSGLTGGLDSILTVSTKHLQTRGPDSDPNDLFPVTRPVSSFARSRPFSVKMSDPNMRTPSATYRKTPYRGGRLAPLDRAKTQTPNIVINGTPCNQEEERNQPSILVTRLGTATDRLHSPPNYRQLPPIPLDSEVSNLSNTVPMAATKSAKRTTFSGSRASSAVHDKDSRSIYKEREKAIGAQEIARPSTTHTFRSDKLDSPFGISRRSSTPLGFSARGGLAGGSFSPSYNLSSKHLGITGSSIGVTHPGEEGEEEAHYQPDHFLQNQWGKHHF